MIILIIFISIGGVMFIARLSDEGLSSAISLLLTISALFVFCNNMIGLIYCKTALGDEYKTTKQLEISSVEKGNKSNKEYYCFVIKTEDKNPDCLKFYTDEITVEECAEKEIPVIQIETYDTDAMILWYIPIMPMLLSEKHTVYLPQNYNVIGYETA